MLEALKFVQGAVAKRDFVPEMKHFVVQDGMVRSFNGTLALCSPIDFDVACAPQAVPMVQAIQRCEDVAALSLTKANRLRVSSGAFTALIKCVELEGLPHQHPEGKHVELDGAAMMEAIRVLTPFVGNDASRPWSNGILLRGQSAYATNNVCLAEFWLGTEMPITVNIPMAAIKEMVRIEQPPTHVQVCDHSVTFHYADGRWLRTQLYSVNDWPELRPLLERPAAPLPVPEGLFEGLEMLKPFADKLEHVHFTDGGMMRTHLEDEEGATYAVPGLHSAGIYRISMLLKLAEVATSIDFTQYPAPLMFYGDRLRGAMMGLRP